jgi:hypothetical protein
MEERLIKLTQLKDFLLDTNGKYDLATELEYYFLNKKSGCKCKFTQVVSQLNLFWEITGKEEYNNYKDN